MKIFVLGSKGMLGRYIYKYLKQFYEVIELNRKEIDASNISEEGLMNTLLHLGIKENSVIINCMGTIKPRVDDLGDLNAIRVNSVFPRILANVCLSFNAKMIHPTTDCVYSGNKGNYTEKDKYDVSDVYGMSKALGEPNNCTVIRTSIIGEEVNQGRSLVEWIKSERGNSVFGFTNHYWNGLTCLQFAIVSHQIIERNSFWMGIRHIYSNILDKGELVQTINNIYSLDITVVPKETPMKCDRSLSSVYENNDSFNIPSLKEQIIEMKKFSNKLYE
jgi:dTDP-4-dehydrorhamnose reductase